MMKAALIILFTLVASAAAELPGSGLWDASVIVNDVEIPFRMEISTKPLPAGAFFNGDLMVRSTGGAVQDDGTLVLQFDHYASKLVAKWDGERWIGTYGRQGRTPYAFQARKFAAAEWTGEEKIPNIAGLWDIPVKSAKGENAWRFIVRQSGPEVTATILRVDGDTGALSGKFQNGKFVLSHFSGARPALVEVTPKADGTLEVVQNRKAAYAALRSNEARVKGLAEPTDPSRHTSVKDPTERFRFSAVDLNGKTVTESDARFTGKVVLLSLGGSWCPNCHDEAPFLVELDKEYAARGLAVVNLSFEEAEQLKDPVRLRAFIKQYGIRHTVLLGGEPEQVRERLPQAVNLNTWPATFFIGRDGRVRGVHAGFAGPATGEAHVKLKAEVRETVERLLNETISVPAPSLQ